MLPGGGLLAWQAQQRVPRCSPHETDCVSTFPAGLEGELHRPPLACQNFAESASAGPSLTGLRFGM